MADKSRNFSAYLLVLALIGAALFYGCGNSVTSDHVSSDEINYSITGSFKIPSQIGSSSRMSLDTVPLPAGVTIYSEAEPLKLATGLLSDANKYIITGLNPAYTHHIVFRYNDGLNTYIARSNTPITFDGKETEKVCNDTLNPKKCDTTITGRLLDSNGKPLQFPNVTIWGQNVVNYDSATGIYTTPLMPKNEFADLLVNSTGYQQTAIPLHFKENPTYHESIIPTTSEKQPPTVEITASKSTYSTGSTVYITATASDPNNDELDFECFLESCQSRDASTTVNLLAAQSSTYEKIYSWKSPDDDCLATLTVKVTNKNVIGSNLSATAKIKITIGTGIYKPNSTPDDLSIVVNTTAGVKPSAYYGYRTYNIVASATDLDGDRLAFSLSIESATGDSSVPLGKITSQNLGNEWKWDTPDLKTDTQYKLTVVVQDKKGHKVSTSEVITLKATQPNEPPTVVKVSPADGTSITSGKEIELKVAGADPESGPLYYKWTYSSGELAEPSIGPSARWIAPIINNKESKTVNVKVSDDGGLYVTATFVLEVIPDPNKKAPEGQIVFSDTNAQYDYNGTMVPLYKAGEVITFTGLATDTNYNKSIDGSNMTWYLIDPNGNQKDLAKAKAAPTFTPTITQRGNYSVKLVMKDLTGISGEAVADFRVNTPPEAEIICNSNAISPNGRMTTPSKFSYKENSITYDVFQDVDTINFIASCTDVETELSALESNSKWTIGTVTTPGKSFTHSPTRGSTPDENSSDGCVAGKLNTVYLVTTDSKTESSATSTYSFFLNTPPVIEIATTTTNGFINTDIINLQAKVTDDADGINMEWFESHKLTTESTWSEYASLNKSGYNPTSVTGKELSQTIQINASEIMDNYFGGKGGDMRLKIIATDSMGASSATEEDFIKFSIVDPHKVNTLEIASGSYKRALDQNFDTLEHLTAPYTFADGQRFSVRGTTDKWDTDMSWGWADIWVDENGKERSGGYKTINSEEILDGNILNGYFEYQQFGTHTIRLTAKSLSYGIIASNSVQVFINSTPGVSFANAKEGDIMRFDTGKPATFTLTIKEDDKEERLGLTWTVVPLNDDMSENTSLKKVFASHDLDPNTTDISPISMNGVQETLVNVSTSNIKDFAVASGAYRVYVCVYDAYNAAATTTVDVLFNTLPTFATVLGQPEGTKLTITVPPVSDNNEDYQFFVEPYTTIGTAPVYLVDKPTMFLNFEINASDTEVGLSGLNMNTYDPDNHIVWKFSDGAEVLPKNRQNLTDRSIQGARFGIGKNTVTAEIRDTFYGKYNGKFNSLAIASYSEDFYIWQSTFGNLVEDYHEATNLFQVDEQGSFYVQYGKVATFTEAYQIIENNQMLNYLNPGQIPADDFLYVENTEGDSYVISDRKIETEIGAPIKVIALMPFADTTRIAMLTDTPYMNGLTQNGEGLQYVVKYNKTNGGSAGEEVFFNAIYNYSLIYIDPFNATTNEGNRKWFNTNASSTHTYDYPEKDPDFLKHVISMTYTDNTGSMLLKDWKSKSYIAPYSSSDLCYLPASNNPPLYHIDGADFSFTDKSKARWLNKLNSLSQKLFITDTGNNRIVKLNTDFSGGNSFTVKEPIDIAQTNSKYVFTLSGSTDSADEGAINLFNVTNSSAEKACAPFAKLISSSDTNKDNMSYRAGKLLNPRAIYFYAQQNGSNYLGGLVILEDGCDGHKNRVQIIRTNMLEWIE